MLFTVNKSPFTIKNFESVLGYVTDKTPILLYEDGVYAASVGSSVEESVKKVLQETQVYALGPDLSARGIEKTIDGVRVIDYSGFVELVEKHNVSAWL